MKSNHMPFRYINDLYAYIPSTKSQIAFPEWSDFLYSIGGWLKETQLEDKRIICTVLLPTRISASLLCALGSLSTKMKIAEDFLSWETFLDIPYKTEIFYLDKNKKGEITKYKGYTEKDEVIKGVKWRGIRNITKGGIYYQAKLLFNKENFNNYNISLVEHSRNSQEITRFFENTVSEFKNSSILGRTTETVIVSNKNAKNREMKEFYLATKDHSLNSDSFEFYPIENLLMLKERRTSIVSSRKETDTDEELEDVASLYILDGKEAFYSDYSPRNIDSGNFLILLNNFEYDEQLLGDLKKYSIVSSKSNEIEIFKNFPKFNPPEIEVAVYLLENN